MKGVWDILDNNIGKEINGFIVKGLSYDKYGHRIYKLKCIQCGKTTTNRELKPHMKWCDCHYDLTNKNIGFLHVNHLVSTTWNRRDQRIWNCTCICGNTIEIKEQALLKGESQTKSCGCINKRTLENNKVLSCLWTENNSG